jgi:hypothetical protein
MRPRRRWPKTFVVSSATSRFAPDRSFVRWSRRNPAVTGVASAAAFLLTTLLVFHVFREVEHREAISEEKGISAARYADWLRLSAEIATNSGQPERTRHALEMIRAAARIEFRDELWELAIRALDQFDVAPGVDLKDADRIIRTLAVSPTGKELVGVEPDGKLIFWDTASGAAWSWAGFGEPLTTIVWSPDGHRLVGVSAKHVWLGNFGRAARSVDDVRAILYKPATVAFSSDSRQVALWGETLAVWDIADGQLLWDRPSPHAGGGSGSTPYQTAAWSPNGKVFAAVPRGEATLEFWAMPGGEPLLPIGVIPEEGTRFVGQRPSSTRCTATTGR